MSVLIKGMEMPKNCICCDLSHEDNWCPAKQDYVDRYSYDTCPLVPVPKHGDLIDREALIKELEITEEDDHNGATLLMAVFLEVLKSAPTIIPSDPAEEGE